VPTDTQILAAGTHAAPVSYEIPNAQELLLLAVNAEFDGSGAGGSYIPAVVIVSDGGVVIARAADPSVLVAAGADAEVSWFPGVKNGGGGAGTTLAWGFVQGTGTAVTVPGDPATGNPTVLTWDQFSFGEDGSGVFSFDPLNPQYIQCSVSPQPGYFLTHAVVANNNNPPTALTFDDVRVFFTSEAPTGSGPELTNVKQVVSSNIGDPPGTGPVLQWALEAWWASRGDTTPIGFSVTMLNFNAAAADLNALAVRFAVSLVAA
jgi:hypothetical protein